MFCPKHPKRDDEHPRPFHMAVPRGSSTVTLSNIFPPGVKYASKREILDTTSAITGKTSLKKLIFASFYESSSRLFQLIFFVKCRRSLLKLKSYSDLRRQRNVPASSSGASFFEWQRRARNEWLVMNRKGPWEGYRQQAKPVVSFPPFFARTSRETSGYEAGNVQFWSSAV